MLKNTSNHLLEKNPTKSVLKQSKIFENQSIVDIKSIITEHPKNYPGDYKTS